MVAQLQELTASFSENPAAAGKSLRDLADNHREELFWESVPLLRTAPGTPGFQYLLTLLLRNETILEHLCDPELFTLDESRGLARMLAKIEPRLDMKLTKAMFSAKDDMEQKAASAAGIRLLDILAGESDGARILPVTTQLIAHPDSRVRSKATLLVGRGNKNHRWVEQRMGEPDARVRAKAVESIWGVTGEGARAVFFGALQDNDHRVTGNGLIGLYRMGDPISIELMLEMACNPAETLRATAAWAMGQSNDTRFLPPLGKMIRETSSLVRASVFRAIAQLKQEQSRQSGAARLQFCVLDVAIDALNVVRIRFALRATDGNAVSGLAPTQFVPALNGELVRRYQVRESVHMQSAAVGFLVPRSVGGGRIATEDAILGLLPHKRRADNWAVLSYESAGFPEVQDAPEPELKFISDTNQIRHALTTHLSRLSAAADLPSGFRAICDAFGTSKNVRRMIWIFPPPPHRFDCGAAEEILRSVYHARCALYCIGCEYVPAIAAVCERSGGAFVLARTPDELGCQIESVYLNLFSRYELTCEALPGSELSLDALSSEGVVRTTITVPAMHRRDPA